MKESVQIKEMPIDSVPSDTLLKNSEAILNPEEEITKYFERQDNQYLKQLEILNGQIGEPMETNTRLVVCIPVAGHQESKNIYQTLESFAKQKRNPKEFEVLLFVNSPERTKTESIDEINKTKAEIERAQREFPELQIRVAQTFLPQNDIRIGNIRKILTDLALLRQRSAGITRDLILMSNDADNQGISEEYIDSYIKYFEEHPEKEGAVGNLQYDPNAFIRFPVIHLRQELSTFLDQVGFKNGNVTLFGGNSAIKSSIYASIGGYPAGLKRWQHWAGDAIRKLRKKKSTLGFIAEGPLVTSGRRAVASAVFGAQGEIIFGDQESEIKMRALDIENFPIFDCVNEEALRNLQVELEQAINQLIDNYEKGDKLGKNSFYYRTNLEKVGIRYVVEENGAIHITNMDRFIERQEMMQKMIKGGERNMAKVIETSWKTAEEAEAIISLEPQPQLSEDIPP